MVCIAESVIQVMGIRSSRESAHLGEQVLGHYGGQIEEVSQPRDTDPARCKGQVNDCSIVKEKNITEQTKADSKTKAPEEPCLDATRSPPTTATRSGKEPCDHDVLAMKCIDAKYLEVGDELVDVKLGAKIYCGEAPLKLNGMQY